MRPTQPRTMRRGKDLFAGPGYFVALSAPRRFQDSVESPMQWYYAIGEQRQGPVDEAEFQRLVAAGTITADTLVWRQGMTGWTTYGATVPPLPTVDDGTEVCAVNGRRYPRTEMSNHLGKWISAEERDGYFQRLRAETARGVAAAAGTAAVPGPFGYGGFWLRFLARVIDGMLQGVAGTVISMMVGAVFGAIGAIGAGTIGAVVMLYLAVLICDLLFGIFYEVWFLRKYDATPGKLILGLKVLRADGAKLSVGRISGRYLASILSALPLMIGYIIAAFDGEKRALHDHLADTRVIRTK